jgi:hypothetical protein
MWENDRLRTAVMGFIGALFPTEKCLTSLIPVWLVGGGSVAQFQAKVKEELSVTIP